VLQRNPSLGQMAAAWEAASARYPQVTSLEDPMLAGSLAPASFGSNTVDTGYMVGISQKLPFPGKVGLKGQNALAEASAAGHDVEDMRLQLVEAARSAFYDYFQASRALEVSAESLRLWQQAKQDAKSRYEAGKGDQQDLLQVEVEIAREQERRLTLEESFRITVARLNTLMHWPADHPLPPAPGRLSGAVPVPGVEVLRDAALTFRPDLQALADRIRAEQAALGLAHKEYYPDVEVSAAYDTIMGNGPLRDLAPQVGVHVNLPLRLDRRDGMVREAQAKIAQRQAELARQTDQVNFQVQEAYEKVLKSDKAVQLYQDKLLPAAELNAQAARTAYVAGRIPAQSRIEAERSLVLLRDRYYETLAESYRRRAALERVIGGPPAKPG
jgi:outer membrane protein, heavy metal efflux system